MKVFICGDSFMAIDPNCPARHFGSILGLTFEVVNLAKAGVSNMDIHLQIKEAIECQAEYVIIGTTDSARLETYYSYPKLHTIVPLEDISLRHFRQGPDQLFVATNVQACLHKNNIHNLSTEVRSAIKEYTTHLYNPHLAELKDKWMFEHWLQQLRNNNIKYFVLPPEFCVYEYVKQNGISAPTSFHTDFATQELAAKLITEELLK